jgi:hypothetical protein
MKTYIIVSKALDDLNEKVLTILNFHEEYILKTR